MEKLDLLFIHAYLLTMQGSGVGFINNGAVGSITGCRRESGHTRRFSERIPMLF